jgi:prevent-host-death family protein
MNTYRMSTVDLRRCIGDAVSRVLHTGDRFVLERRGQPVAAIISYADLERLQRLEDERDVELLRLARERSQGTMPASELITRFEQVHGEPLEQASDVQRPD